jgi:outer membrane protein OmpA-like peptidoglycan-associated protein/tetratricopeptide (TPR) repeat protein
MQRISFIFIVAIAVLMLSACGADTAMKKGDKFFALGEYYDAASQYKKAYSQTSSKDKPKRGERSLKMADCYRRINQTQRAMAAYTNAMRFHQADSMAVFYLGQLQLKNGSYKEAEKTFSSLLDGTLVIGEPQEADDGSKTKKGKSVRKKRRTKAEMKRDSLKAVKAAEREALVEKAKARRDSLRAMREARRDSLRAMREARRDSVKGAKAAWNNIVKTGKRTLLDRILFRKHSLTEWQAADSQLKDSQMEDSLKAAEIRKREEARKRTVPDERLIKVGLESARKAPKWRAEAEYSGYTVKKQELFNSRRAEYSPMLCGDDSDQLFFSSTRNQAKGEEYSGITGMKNADIFFSQKDDKGKWSKPEAIESDLNSEDDEGACAFTPDGKTMYLTVCKTDPNYPRYAKIAKAPRSDASWGKPTIEDITRDTLSTFAHPAISPDGMWLYFVSDMPGGMGGYDIWRIQMTSNGFVGLENVGEPVNTPGNEMFPTFRPNGDLYFSSDGHPGFGGLDIFIAKPVEEEIKVSERADTLAVDSIAAEATPPSLLQNYELEHPGWPLNSPGDDFGMTFEGLHNRGYFSSNRGDARGWDHIYSFEKHEVIQTVRGWVYEQDGYELPAGLVYMVGNDGTNLKLSVRGDGSFEQEIKPGVSYVFLGTCKGYLNHKEELRVEPVLESEEYTLQFPLANISAPVLIENIFYDFDKATLRPESSVALDKLVDLLNENPNVTIELSAHTDCRGSDQYNERLSQRRAESVVNYLIEHGIAADRLTPKGYGENRPKTIKRKLTEKYDWLKADDVLTEEFINALGDEEKKEICHQLNRRTEFIVLRTTYGMFDAEGKLKEQPATAKPKKEEEPQQEQEDLW